MPTPPFNIPFQNKRASNNGYTKMPPKRRTFVHPNVNTLLMTKYEKIYQTLREEFSDEEIISGYVFPDDLDQKEKDEIEEEFKKLRFIYWWKLYAKRIEADVRTDHEKRKIESKKVRNQLRFRA